MTPTRLLAPIPGRPDVSAIADAPVLLGVGVLAGIVSTVASLASVVSYPALLAVGLSPVSANVTNTVALMFTAVGAAAGSRQELTGQAHRVRTLGLLTAGGGGAGAALLLLTPRRGFEYSAPLLVALGSLLLLRRRGPETEIRQDDETGDAPADQAEAAAERARGRPAGSWLSRAAVFGVAIYIGYFGAAGGIIMLAVLVRVYAQSLAKTNALKNVLAGLANAVAGIGFAIFGPVRWSAALPLAAGFLIGGWIGPALVRRLPADRLRIFIGVCGLAVAIRLAVSTY
ncbi:MAG TPA: sulfite exporter TauE/SafE family protein [Streptosporangiaceae bacterium]|nr:sulfite exporter TauE/SafE family protein [Streptosporangiaceae bacterium]